jgi:hypothetical protein
VVSPLVPGSTVSCSSGARIGFGVGSDPKPTPRRRTVAEAIPSRRDGRRRPLAPHHTTPERRPTRVPPSLTPTNSPRSTSPLVASGSRVRSRPPSGHCGSPLSDLVWARLFGGEDHPGSLWRDQYGVDGRAEGSQRRDPGRGATRSGHGLVPHQRRAARV